MQRPTLTLEEVGRLELAAAPRERLILRTLYETGCTVSELVALRGSDIADREDIVVLGGAGGGGGRKVAIQHRLVLELRALRSSSAKATTKTAAAKTAGKKGCLFPSREQGRMTVRRVEQILAAAGRKGLGRNVTPHQLRASRIIHDFLNRVPLAEIERKVGLKSVQPHLYAHFRREEEGSR